MSEASTSASLDEDYRKNRLSLFVVPWLERNGLLVVYSSLAGTIAATLVLVGVFYVLGKRYRLFWHRHNLLQRLHLEAD